MQALRNDTSKLLDAECGMRNAEYLQDAAFCMPHSALACRASIVIVGYNSHSDLERCLPTVLQTIGGTDEVIVVDNASTDSTALLAQRFPQVRLLRNELNVGFAAATNQGVEAAQGVYIIALNPDTTVTPGWLDALIGPLQPTPDGASSPVGLTTARILLLDQPDRVNTCGNIMHYTGLTVCRGLGRPAHTPELARAQAVAAVSGACCAMRRALWRTLGGLDATFFTYLEDTDLSLRARLAGYECRYVPEAVIYHAYKPQISAHKFYYLERNRPLMLLASYQLRTLVLLLPALALAEAVTWGYALRQGPRYLAAKLRAYGWLLGHGAQVRAKRRQTQMHRRVTDAALLTFMTPHLEAAPLAESAAGRAVGRLLQPFFQTWYRLVLRQTARRAANCWTRNQEVIMLESHHHRRRADHGTRHSAAPAPSGVPAGIRNPHAAVAYRPPRALRIAQVSAAFPPSHSGPGNVCYHNAVQLARLGHHVTVFTAAVPGTAAQETLDGVEVRRLRPLARNGNAPLLPGLLSALRGFDLIHLHTPFFSGELAALAARRSGTPLVITYHQDVLLDGLQGLVERAWRHTVGRWTLRAAARVLFTSLDYGMASQVRALLAGREQAIGELPNGVDVRTFTPGPASAELRARYELAPQDKVALLVAGLDKAQYFKGVDTFLSALTWLPPYVKGIIVGEGDLRASYEVNARLLGVGDRVIFAGCVPSVELPALYRLADVTVLPSTTMGEAFGLVLVESLASGTPVIASDLPGVRTVVGSGHDGLLVTPRDPVALAGAVSTLLRYETQRHIMGQAGRAKVEQHYDWRQIGRQLEALYCQVLAETSMLPLLTLRPFAKADPAVRNADHPHPFVGPNAPAVGGVPSAALHAAQSRIHNAGSPVGPAIHSQESI